MDTERSGFAEAAHLIDGDGDHPWLKDFLEWVAASRLMFARRVDEEQPGRAAMAARLRGVQQASEFLLAILDKPDMPVLGHLDCAGPRPIDAATLNSLHHGLGEIRYRAARALENIPRRGGRDRAWAIDSASPRGHCAMLIAEAWRAVHGDPPRPGNRNAQQAAEALWRASGGPFGMGWGDNPLSGWRKCFQGISQLDEHEQQKVRVLLEEFRVRSF